jgi:hypothetical protein
VALIGIKIVVPAKIDTAERIIEVLLVFGLIAQEYGMKVNV